jgi:hypothetical protein
MPLPLRPTRRALLSVAWWQSTVTAILPLAQLLDVADPGFPAPHQLFSATLYAIAVLAGDALADAAVWAAVARQWGYACGYLAPGDTQAIALWDRTMAAAHAQAYLPWRQAVLAPWPQDAFPPCTLTTARDDWRTFTAPPASATAFPRQLGDAALTTWLCVALDGAPPAPASSGADAAAAAAAVPVPVPPTAGRGTGWRERLATFTPSTERPSIATDVASSGTGRGRGTSAPVPTAPPAAAAAAVPAARWQQRLNSSTLTLPIMTHAEEIVERTRAQRLLCIQVRTWARVCTCESVHPPLILGATQGETGCGKSSVVPLLLYYDAVDRRQVRFSCTHTHTHTHTQTHTHTHTHTHTCECTCAHTRVHLIRGRALWTSAAGQYSDYAAAAAGGAVAGAPRGK